MEQTWKNHSGERLAARIPANLSSYVDLIGVDATVRLIMAYGGSPIYLAQRGTGGTGYRKLVSTIGEEATDKLAKEMGIRIHRCPIAPSFVARHFRGQGISVLEIARILHRTDKTIREYLSVGGGSPAARLANREVAE